MAASQIGPSPPAGIVGGIAWFPHSPSTAENRRPHSPTLEEAQLHEPIPSSMGAIEFDGRWPQSPPSPRSMIRPPSPGRMSITVPRRSPFSTPMSSPPSSRPGSPGPGSLEGGSSLQSSMSQRFLAARTQGTPLSARRKIAGGAKESPIHAAARSQRQNRPPSPYRGNYMDQTSSSLPKRHGRASPRRNMPTVSSRPSLSEDFNNDMCSPPGGPTSFTQPLGNSNGQHNRPPSPGMRHSASTGSFSSAGGYSNGQRRDPSPVVMRGYCPSSPRLSSNTLQAGEGVGRNNTRSPQRFPISSPQYVHGSQVTVATELDEHPGIRRLYPNRPKKIFLFTELHPHKAFVGNPVTMDGGVPLVLHRVNSHNQLLNDCGKKLATEWHVKALFTFEGQRVDYHSIQDGMLLVASPYYNLPTQKFVA